MTVTTPQPADDPVEPAVKIQTWAELHVDNQVFRLIPPWNLEKLAAQLEAAIADRTVVKVRAYTELNGEATILVNPWQATVVYLAKRPELVGRSGMPD